MSNDADTMQATPGWQLPARIRGASARSRERLASALARWRAWRQARADARLNRHHVRDRNEHERFLAKARDVYELERLERDWQRRHADL